MRFLYVTFIYISLFMSAALALWLGKHKMPFPHNFERFYAEQAELIRDAGIHDKVTGFIKTDICENGRIYFFTINVRENKRKYFYILNQKVHLIGIFDELYNAYSDHYSCGIFYDGYLRLYENDDEKVFYHNNLTGNFGVW